MKNTVFDTILFRVPPIEYNKQIQFLKNVTSAELTGVCLSGSVPQCIRLAVWWWFCLAMMMVMFGDGKG